ncbi:DUF488 domain-containing protein [Pseudonocardia asaccharolytica]|uniref:MarR family transcriptional regulator n=1 Tax=Pseudonocardia asaccharolytica DSM 44247 = NBRC 16224 TaxID=1123024 RepID=A0A511D7X6_9PSEU|nr:DUF488 domain-containing protein [Pseudonocardia asaccharolytica]GEL19038.1 hypothetical protein PA7_28750 [Pseudonocardia asaccharolytica DSM 44247 = NBRC 16224]
MTTPQVQVRRIYQPAADGDGYRVLVDRLWPRGIAKDTAEFDEWCKDVAPSTDLRKWYGHDPDRFAEFGRRYRAELGQAEPSRAVGQLRARARQGPVTLLTATKDPAISAAAVLADVLREQPER